MRARAGLHVDADEKKSDRVRVLTWMERAANYAQRSARSSVEHFNQNGLRRHRAFGQNNLNHELGNICNMVHCTAYAEAVARRLRPPREGFGAWPHSLSQDDLRHWRQIMTSIDAACGDELPNADSMNFD